MRRTVILAAGDFPQRGGEPFRLLASACRVVACDSAAEQFHRVFHRWPDVVVGDMDSAVRVPEKLVVRVPDPSHNDLEKAISFCREKGWDNLVIVGASGKREDHAIGNIYRALDAQVPVVSDFGEFLPIFGRLSFRTWKGNGISIFALSPHVKMSSRGLRWKLDGVAFDRPYVATLNRASADNVTVVSNAPAFVYVARNPKAVRAVVSLGSNLGDRRAFLRRAVRALAALPRTRLVDVSTIIETDPVDVPAAFADLRFLNQVILLETELEPLAFSRAMHGIEDQLGRRRTVRNGPRTIDIDLIIFGAVRMRTAELILPHPRAAKRDFVRKPLEELGLQLQGD